MTVAVVVVSEDVIVMDHDVEKLAGKSPCEVLGDAGILAEQVRVDADPAAESRAEPEAILVRTGQAQDDPHRLPVLAANLHRAVEPPHLRLPLEDDTGPENVSYRFEGRSCKAA